jgi:hypothetical protein
VPYADRAQEKILYGSHIIKLVCLQTSENFGANTCRYQQPGTVSRSCSKKPQIAKKGMCLFKGTSSFRMGGSDISKPMIRSSADIIASEEHGSPGIGSKWCLAFGLLERSRCFSRQRIQLMPRFSVCSGLWSLRLGSLERVS